MMLNSSQNGSFIQVNNTIQDTIPMFLRGGYTLATASVSTSLLNLTNAKMIFHVAFEKNSTGYYISNGYVLGFLDLYNDTKLYESCFETSCLVFVKAQATVTVGTTQTHYEIVLSFSGDVDQTLDIYLSYAYFYGLDSSKCVSISLGTAYKLKVPYTFTMNIYV